MGEVVMKRNGNEGEEYINAFPKFKKWINECICCHEKGYKPNMPEKITINIFTKKIIDFAKKLIKYN